MDNKIKKKFEEEIDKVVFENKVLKANLDIYKKKNKNI